MRKTVSSFILITITVVLVLSGCMPGRTEKAVSEQSQISTTVTQVAEEVTEQDTQSQTETTATETTEAAETTSKPPRTRPQTTAEDVTSATTLPVPETTVTTTAAEVTSTTTPTIAETTVTTTAATTAAATTTTTAVTTTAVTTVVALSSPRDILNSASLHPQKTNDDVLDEEIQEIFDNIFRPGMSTYEKVTACYDYVINHSVYGRKNWSVSARDVPSYEKDQDSKIVVNARNILKTGTGVCDDYSAVFLVMTRAIGLDCYYTHGCTTNTKGETNSHIWNTITVNGVDYIFDTQVEDKKSSDGIKYQFFCKSYDSSIAQIYSKYDLSADKAAYNAFRLKNS
ncbi:MAG: transglutaminase-like domain-containing protein [Clostridiales bacterium]|nr:transglutaminase-like domain-containing protein [Clostridiales bacterium]